MVNRCDRGQLLLLTAVALAFVILGLAVLLNAAVTTDVRAPDDPAVDVVETDRLAADLDRGLIGLIARVNGGGTYPNEADLAGAADANLTRYMDVLFEAVGDRRGALVDLEVGEMSTGTLVIDANLSSRPLLHDEAPSDRSIRVDPNDPAPIAGLQLAFTEAALENATDATGVLVYGDGACVLVTVSIDGDNATVSKSTVDCIDPVHSDPAEEECAFTDGRVVVDLGPGTPTASTCSVDAFDAVDPIEAPDAYGLAIHEPNATDAGYRFVVGDRTFEHVTDGEPDGDAYVVYEDDDTPSPYIAPVVWSLPVEVTLHARASERTATTTFDLGDDPTLATHLEVAWHAD